ncbi:MAG: hypothetical protein GY711_01975 [bacterium]|nr:hypothetical protein [bacterium]
MTRPDTDCVLSILEHETVVEVSLRRGWSGQVRALDEQGRPLAGVEVLADAVTLGFTDHAGRLDCFHASKPGELSLAMEGWTLSDGDVSPEDGSYREDVPFLACTLRPDR